MHENIYPVFKFLSGLPVTLNSPVNFWLWLLFAGAPGLVFFVNVERSGISHIARVLCAIGLTYVLLNLAYHARDAFAWRDFQVCQENSAHPDMSRERHEECRHHISMLNASSAVFLLGLGWIPAAFYIGIWEILWRIRHRKAIKGMGKKYKGRWFSTITMTLVLLPFIAFYTLWIFV